MPNVQQEQNRIKIAIAMAIKELLSNAITNKEDKAEDLKNKLNPEVCSPKCWCTN